MCPESGALKEHLSEKRVRGGDDERQRSYGFRIVSGPGKSGGGSLIFKRPERAGIQYILVKTLQ